MSEASSLPPLTAPVAELRADMENCPAARKVLLLNWGGTLVLGMRGDDVEAFAAWAPLPRMGADVRAKLARVAV